MEIENQVNPFIIDTEKYPRLIRRFMSLIIDQLFIVTCMVIFSQLLAGTDSESTASLRGFLFFGLFLIYEPFCMILGCTLGNLIAGIRVRKFGNEDARINIFQAYIRIKW